MKPFALTLVLLLTLPLIARAEDAKVDDEGFIRDWLLLGPIATDEPGADAVDKQQIPNEAKLQPREGEKTKVGAKELKWTAVKAKDYYLDINQTLGADNEDPGYLVAYVVAGEEMAGLTAMIGSNDQAKLYVNGKEVFKFTETRVIEKDTDKAAGITLNKGVNTIVFKVLNEKNNWQACLRFTGKDGKPVKNVTVRTNP